MITQKKNRGSRCYTAPAIERDIKMAVERKSYTIYIQQKFLKLRGEIKNDNKKIIPC